MTVSTLMTRNVITVGPELPLDKLISSRVDQNISGVPVVDARCCRLTRQPCAV